MEKHIPKYCNNKPLRDWVMGPNFCDGDYSKCKHVVKFGKIEYCGKCPPRCTLHQIIRTQAECLFCKYATKKLSYSKCTECLSSETRINYVRIDD